MFFKFLITIPLIFSQPVFATPTVVEGLSQTIENGWKISKNICSMEKRFIDQGDSLSCFTLMFYLTASTFLALEVNKAFVPLEAGQRHPHAYWLIPLVMNELYFTFLTAEYAFPDTHKNPLRFPEDFPTGWTISFLSLTTIIGAYLYHTNPTYIM